MNAPAIAKVLFRLAFWLPLVVCTYLALVPELPQHPVFRLSDVVLHGGAFIYLSFALVILLETNQEARSIYLRTSGWLILYGAGLEFAQYFSPGRSPEWKDMVVDVLGIVVGMLLARWMSRPFRSLLGRLLQAY